MPTACCSGQTRHAVATQVERGVRQHCARFRVMGSAIWRRGWHSKAEYVSCWKPELAAPMFICQPRSRRAGKGHVLGFSANGARPQHQTCQHSIAAKAALLWHVVGFLEVCRWLREPQELHFERLRRSCGCLIRAARRTFSECCSGAWLCCLTFELT
jgi:hypothetical protein